MNSTYFLFFIAFLIFSVLSLLAEELGFRAKEMKRCIYPLVNTLHREFQQGSQYLLDGSSGTVQESAKQSHVYLTIRPLDFFDYKTLPSSATYTQATEPISQQTPVSHIISEPEAVQDQQKTEEVNVVTPVQAHTEDTHKAVEQVEEDHTEVPLIPAASDAPSENTSILESIETEYQESVVEEVSVKTVEGVTSTQPPFADDQLGRTVIEINGVSYLFEFVLPQFLAVEVSADDLAMSFCQQHGFSLLQAVIRQQKLNSKRQIVELIRQECYLPLRGVLISKIQAVEATITPTEVVM